ncbi:MAG TPA: Hsp20/alpha crystallin family protein [Candidatus Margulisiibacteriota bacterium]|nr:Hsp20/alpha crystallin family protein [Candidatus Margulisiibacteriota bacterium]
MAKAKEKKGEGKTREIVPVTRVPSLPLWEREFDRLFDRLSHELRFPWPSLWGTERWWPTRELRLRTPPVDVYEEKDAVVVKAELPGMSKEDIDVNLTGLTLTIKGEKKREEEVKEADYHRSERAYGAIVRTIELPAEVNAEAAEATFKEGVLNIRLPKTEQAKQKQVKVKVE